MEDAIVLAFSKGNIGLVKHMSKLSGCLRQKRKAKRVILSADRKQRQDYYRWCAGRCI